MNILCITHADFETPGVIESWANDKGYSFQVSKPYNGDKLPKANSFDFLVIMGGPQSSLKLEEFPYLADEISLIKETISQDKRVLGFCLGAQLIGEALGARTKSSPEKEIGVYPIMLTAEGAKDPLFEGLPIKFQVIHWHNDMPGLLEDSILLAYSEGCPNQIIRYKPYVYAFQCHLEIDIDGMKKLIKAVPEDLSPSKFTQNKSELLSQDYVPINEMMNGLLDRFLLLNS